MGILIDDQKRILVQGITGREGQQRTRLMLEYGSKVIGGVTPGRGGQQVLGLPVFNTVAEAKSALGRIDISVIFVPAPRVKQAALEAISQDIQLLVLIPDRVPVYDVLEIHHAARQRNCHFLGPNTLGALNPGKAIVGMIGGRAASAKDWIKPGVVGISSRSGGMTTSLAYYLSRQYTGLSTAVHIGGDAVIGDGEAGLEAVLAVSARPRLGSPTDLARSPKGAAFSMAYCVTRKGVTGLTDQST